MLFRKYDDELQVYSYKSKCTTHVSSIMSDLFSVVFGTFNDISALMFFQVQVRELRR